MSDEIAQVCKLEIEGVQFLFKATLQTAQILARMIRAIIQWGGRRWEGIKKGIEKHKEKKLNAPGEKTIAEVMKLSEGGPAVVMEIDEKFLSEILQTAEEKGLHFAYTIDFNPSDKLTPILIPEQEAAIWGSIIKTIKTREISKLNKEVKGYDQKINEAKEKMRASGFSTNEDQKKEELSTLIENLMQAKAEAEKMRARQQDIVNKRDQDVSISFMDYLKQSKGTDFEKNPEQAVAEMEKGVEIGQKFSAKDAFQPVRHKEYMPETGTIFYMPETGMQITRTFNIDEKSGLLYSEYTVQTPNGESYDYDDHNMTADKWNTDVLPEMLGKAEILEKTQCRMFDTQEKLDAYIQFHGNVKSQAESNVEKAQRSGEPVFSSAESKAEVEHAVSEMKKGLSSANIVNNDKVKIEVGIEQLRIHDGKFALDLKNGEMLLFSGVSNERKEKDKAIFEIEKDANVVHIKNRESTMNSYSILGEQCPEVIKNASLSSTPTKKQSHSKGQ